MSVKRRLAALNRQLPESPFERPGLALRIQRLRATPHRAARNPDGDEKRLRRALQGVEIADGVILIERRIASGSMHGSRSLGKVESLNVLFPDAIKLLPERLLFLDTETTGLCGGSGTLAFLVGIARLEREDLIVRQYLLTRFGGEQAMLNAVATSVRASDVLVSYNGKSFDLPLLEARNIMADVKSPLGSISHLDLLFPVRRAFSRRWEDCRLARVERRLLGFHRHNDLPGAEAPAAWFDWIQQGDDARLPLVCRHNRSDLLSLALLLPLLPEVYRNPGLYGADVSSVARLHLKAGREELALQLLLREKSNLEQAGLALLAGLLKRSGQLRGARAIWKTLAAGGDQAARVRLAKHYEHDLSDYARALDCADGLCESDEKQRRCSRLRHKLGEIDRQSRFEYG